MDETRWLGLGLGLGHSIGVFGLGRLVVIVVAEGSHRRRNEQVRAQEGPRVAFDTSRFRSVHVTLLRETLSPFRPDVKGRSSLDQIGTAGSVLSTFPPVRL